MKRSETFFKKFRTHSLTCRVVGQRNGLYYASASGHPAGQHATVAAAGKAARAKAREVRRLQG